MGQEGGWSYHAKGFWVSVSPSGGGAASGANVDSSVSGEGGLNNEPHAPSITLIGSSNYTHRSHTLDTEANALVFTANPELQRRFGEEIAHLKKYAGAPVHLGRPGAGGVTNSGRSDGAGDGGAGVSEFDRPERKVSWRVKFMMWVVKVVGGAL